MRRKLRWREVGMQVLAMLVGLVVLTVLAAGCAVAWLAGRVLRLWEALR